MTEAQQNNIQFAGAGTPPNVSGQATNGETANTQRQEQQTGEAKQYLTAEDAEALFDDLFNRKGQSIADRTSHRVQKVLEAAQAQGVTMTPQQAQSLLDQVDGTQSQQRQQNPPNTTQPTQAAQPADARQAEEPAEVDPTIAIADRLLTQAGVQIEADDPEDQLIDKETTDPVKFLYSIQAAIQAKQQRLAKAGDPARLPTLGGGGRPANPVQSIKDPNELWKLATRK